MANRTRSILLKFFVSQKELELIQAKMAQYGTENLSAYLRKIAIDGYVVNLELPELNEMVFLLRRSSSGSTKWDGFTMPIWRICTKSRICCGTRRRRF